MDWISDKNATEPNLPGQIPDPGDPEMKILIIDDHALFREGLVLLLEALGQPVQTLQAENSEAAMRQIAGHPQLDLVLLDLVMPGPGGIELLPEIKRLVPAAPVVILSADLVYALIAGAVVGLGLLMFVVALRPARTGIAAGIARLDADRQPSRFSVSEALLSNEGMPSWQLRLGSRLATAFEVRGFRVTSLRSDLAVLGRSLEGFLASTVLFGVGGLLFGPVLAASATVAGIQLGFTVSVGVTILFALLAALLPLASVRREAAARRQDFRHAVGAFLDLVSMNLAGGRGVPEALTAAASIGGGWPFARLRDTLAFARLQGLTPWAALGRLGDEVGINELRDLAAALALVADDGAKIRDSLAARAATLRRRELAEMEGRAGERSQSMLVAQMLIVLGYLLFLAYPAVIRIL